MTTSKGNTYTLDLSRLTVDEEDTVCDSQQEYADPSERWDCPTRRYGGAEVAEFQIDSDETLGTLRIEGAGADVSSPIHVQARRLYGPINTLEDIDLGCGWTYRIYSSGYNCGCMRGREGEAHGVLDVSWEFEADPATAFRVTMEEDTVAFRAGYSASSTYVYAKAVYADGVLAPFDESAPLSYAAPTTYGSLGLTPCSQNACGETVRVASGQNGRYGWQRYTRYFADGVGPGGAVIETDGPEDDTPIPIEVSGGGASGVGSVLLRAPLRLQVTAAPDSIEVGEEAAVSVSLRGSGADEVTEDAPVTLALTGSAPGTLRRTDTGEEGGSLTVPLSVARSGVVFAAGGAGPAAAPAAADSSLGRGWIVGTLAGAVPDSAEVAVGVRLGIVVAAEGEDPSGGERFNVRVEVPGGCSDESPDVRFVTAGQAGYFEVGGVAGPPFGPEGGAVVVSCAEAEDGVVFVAVRSEGDAEGGGVIWAEFVEPATDPDGNLTLPTDEVPVGGGEQGGGGGGGGGGAAGGLVVTVSPAVLRPGERGVVSVASADPDTPLDDEDTVDLSLDDEAAALGTLRRANSGAEGDALDGVPVSAIRAGDVVYVVETGGTDAAPPSSQGRLNARSGVERRAERLMQDAEDAPAVAALLDDPGASSVLQGIPIGVLAALSVDPARNGEGGAEVDPLLFSFGLFRSDGSPLAAGDQIAPNDRITGRVAVDKRVFGPLDGRDYVANPEGYDQTALVVCATHANPTGSGVVMASVVAAQGGMTLTKEGASIGRCAVAAREDVEGLFTYNDFPEGPAFGTLTYNVDLPSDLFPRGIEVDVRFVGGLAGIREGGAVFLATRGGGAVKSNVRLTLRNPGDPSVELSVVENADFNAEAGVWRISAGNVTGPRMPDIRVRARVEDLPGESVASARLRTTVEYELERRRQGGEFDARCPTPRQGRLVLTTERTLVSGDSRVTLEVPFRRGAIEEASFSAAADRQYPGGADVLECGDSSPSWTEANGWSGRFEELAPSADIVDKKFDSPTVGTGRWSSGQTEPFVAPEPVFIGGSVQMVLELVIDGNVVASDELPDSGEGEYLIKGTNPEPAVVRQGVVAVAARVGTTNPGLASPGYLIGKADLYLEVQAMVFHESGKSYHQFNPVDRNRLDTNIEGYPLYNNVNGMGLSQLDFPPSTEMQLWNWLYNAEGGVTHYMKGRTLAVEVALGDDPDVFSSETVLLAGGSEISIQEFVFRSAYGRYNGGGAYYEHTNSGWKVVAINWVRGNADSAWNSFISTHL